MVAFVLIAAGAAVPFAFNLIPAEKTTERQQAISKANRLCNTLWGLRPVALQPKGMVFTFIDQGPRLIAVTHHDAVGGPYHRNGQQIADVMTAPAASSWFPSIGSEELPKSSHSASVGRRDPAQRAKASASK